MTAAARPFTRRNRRRRRRAQRPRRRWLLLALPAIVLVLAAAGAGAGVVDWFGTRLSACTLGSLRPIALGSNSFVYASDGALLGVIPAAKNRQPLRLSAMSHWLPTAVVAVEDRRFFQHGGIDYHAILRAALTDLEHGTVVQGGSTLTQQLVRNLYITNARRTFSRKLKEACLANKLAQVWPRRRILQTYLNQVYFGNHAYGVEAAAQTYFSKGAGALTLPEAALLAGLPQAPTAYDPFRHPQVALRRRNEVIGALLTSGKIQMATFEWAARRPLGLRRGVVYQQIHEPGFFGYAERQLVHDFGSNLVEGGGLQVTTTLDPRLQRLAVAAIRSVLHRRGDPAAAVVALDPWSGAIRAMAALIPGRRGLQFNLATQSGRQAGSAFKPFVLTTAFEQGISPYSTWNGPPELRIDDPRCYTGNQPWDVHNFADESAGTMNLLQGIAHSVNTIFAQLVVAVGPPTVVATAHRMGISTKLEPVCSITLGTQPVNPLEMTDAYATLAARGVHHHPQALETVRSADGRWLLQLHPRGRRVLPQNVADLVTYALQGVVQSGTGTAAALDRPVAGKTGTAENSQDAWFCGYVPQLATCVWVGYPHRERPLVDVEGVANVVGGTLPAAIWHAFMQPALTSTTVRNFATPNFDQNTIYPHGSFAASTSSSSSGSSSSSSSEGSSSPAPSATTTPAATPKRAPAPSPRRSCGKGCSYRFPG